MQVDTFKIELGIYLNTCGLSSEALNTLSNAGITTTCMTLYNQKNEYQHNILVELKNFLIIM